MTHPTTEQLNDPKWWDENAPKGATHLIDGEFTMWTPSRDELIWREETWRQQGLGSFSLEDYRSGCMWDVVSRPTTAPCENVSTANARWKHNRRHPKQEYHPDPGTEALATWLEAPDGGDRRPERVYTRQYDIHPLSNRPQVWLTRMDDGVDMVLDTEDVLFEPLPSTRERLRETVSVYLSADVTALVDEILSRFDVSFKE